VGALAACGDSDSSADSSTSKETTSTSQSVVQGSGGKAGTSSPKDGPDQSQQSDDSSDSGSDVETAPLKVSGGGSAQYRVKEGDNSIQNFGEESDETELEEAATALHDFLVARAEEDWAAACFHMAKTVKEQLAVLASRSDELDGKGCPAILETLTPPLPAAVRQQSTIVDAGSLRLEDERAFLIYRGFEGTNYAMLMEEEDGAWKVGSLSATPMP
jgi:hypothetical protein